jgi:SHS2 domain-containing protein
VYENAAFALFAMEGAIPLDSDTRLPEIARAVDVEGIDAETLLVNWLNELLFLQDRYHEAYYRFKIDTLDSQRLHANIGGLPNRKIEKLIKAATFHNLKIERTAEGWQATVVVDV